MVKRCTQVKVYIKNDGDTGFISEVIVQNSNNDKVEAITFTNSYQPLEIKVDPPVRKIVLGAPPEDAVFRFRFTADAPEYPMPEGSADGEKIVYIKGSGVTDIGTWTYNKASTYTYTVSEVNTNESGYKYDTIVYTVKDVVADIDGQLVCDRTISNNLGESVSEIVFTNEYSASPKTGDDTDNTWLIVIIIIAGVVGAGCIIYLAVSKGRKKAYDG